MPGRVTWSDWKSVDGWRDRPSAQIAGSDIPMLPEHSPLVGDHLLAWHQTDYGQSSQMRAGSAYRGQGDNEPRLPS